MSGFRLPISSRSSKKVFLKAFVWKKSGLIALICCFLSLIFYACICFSNGPWTKLLSNQMKVTKDLLKEKNLLTEPDPFQLCEVITRTREALSFVFQHYEKIQMDAFAAFAHYHYPL